MELFYIVVLSIAVMLLIIILAFIGVGMRRHGGGRAWPPVEATCPDYWKIDPTDQNYCLIPQPDPANPNTPPRNTGSMFQSPNFNTIDPGFNSNSVYGYDAANNRINFTDPHYFACSIQNWAKKWGIYWDGYSNYNGKC